MSFADLTPLTEMSTFTDADRKVLGRYWITTAEEFIATTRLANTQYQKGLEALGALLGRSDAEMLTLFNTAVAQARQASAFAPPPEREYATGLILDNPDDEAFSADDAVAFSLTERAQLPPAYSLVERFPPVQDQGERNTCVAFTLVAMVQCLRQDPTDLSEQFLFWLCKTHDGLPDNPHGTQPSVGARLVRDIGICREELWRYHAYPVRDGGRERNVGQGPPANLDALKADAAPRRVARYRLLKKQPSSPGVDVHAIRAEIAAGQAVLIGLPVGSFWGSSAQATVLGRLRPLLPGEQASGGHAMCVAGYCNDPTAPGGGYFIVRNSWGTGWASENPDGPGYAHIPYAVVAEQCLAALVLDPLPEQAPAAEHSTDPAPLATPNRVPAPESAVGQAAEAAPLATPNRVPAPESAVGHAAEQALLATLTDQAATLSPTGLSRLIGALAARLTATLEAAAPPRLPEPPPGIADATPDALEADSPPTATTPPADPVLPVGTSAPVPVGTTYEHVTDPAALIVPNGIDPTLGKPRYRLDLLSAREVAATNHWSDKDAARHLHAAVDRLKDPTLGVTAGYGYDKLAISENGAGWGLVVAANEDTAILKALTPLILKRCEDQGLTPPPLEFLPGETCGAWLRRVVGDAYYHRPLHAPTPTPIFVYDSTAAERASTWCSRHLVGMEPVAPRRGLPFYLLLVGRPGARFANDPHIPFAFQYDLDFFWGVGRLCFTTEAGEHRYAAYIAYAERLVAYERGQVQPRERQLSFFATRHNLDPSTQLSATELVVPLLAGSEYHDPLAERFGFAAHDLTEAAATRTNLEYLLSGGHGRPALLFSATHGIDLPLGHPDQLSQQGALLCQDWDGLDRPSREHWLTGDDLPAATSVEGLIAVCFACFGLGCPAHDQFRFNRQAPPTAIAPYPFIAQFPQRLLEQGALAIVGHVDRAWSYSFRDNVLGVTSQTQAFEDLLGRIMEGKRLGEATDQFNTRQGQLAMRLTDVLDNYRFAPAGAALGLTEIGPRWAAFNDARGYALLGDPAARLQF